MPEYELEVVQTRTAILVVEAPTVEHARAIVRDDIPYADEWDEWEDGYNIHINKARRVDWIGTD